MSVTQYAMRLRIDAQENELAAKLIDGLSRLDEKPESAKRWIWELIQNAKDASLGPREQATKIQIILSPEKVEFLHSGNPFTTKDLVSLICQTSMKERKLNENEVPETTGKFGTGFMTTYLLSRVIEIKGVYQFDNEKAKENKFQRFELVLDRATNEKSKMMKKSRKAFEVFEQLDNPQICPKIERYQLGKNFDTSFSYSLDQDSIDIAKKGIEDFKNSVFQMLIFNPKIESILLKDAISKSKDLYKVTNKEMLSRDVEMYTVSNKNEEKYYIKAENNYTSVCIEVQKFMDSYSIVPKPPEAPILFADFPLIGSERNYTYPCYLNSHIFLPNEERSSVLISEKQMYQNNRKTFEESGELMLKLFDFAHKSQWEGLHNFAIIKTPNVQNYDWFYKEIMSPYMQRLANEMIIRTASGVFTSLTQVKFPVYQGQEYNQLPCEDQERQKVLNDRFSRLWELFEKSQQENLICNDFKYVSTWENILSQEWEKILQKENNIHFIEVAKLVHSSGNFNNLTSKLDQDTYPEEWLQHFYSFMNDHLQRSDLQNIIQDYKLFLNQHHQFEPLKQLYSDIDIDETYKRICHKFGYDLKNILLAKICEEEVEEFVENYGSKMRFQAVEQHIYEAVTFNYAQPHRKALLLTKIKQDKQQQQQLILYMISCQPQAIEDDSNEEDDENVQILEEDKIQERSDFYQFIKVYQDKLPAKRYVKNNSEKIFKACKQHMLQKIKSELEQLDNFSQLVSKLNVENQQAFEWLNQFYLYYINEYSSLEELKVILNQNEEFVSFLKPRKLCEDNIIAWVENSKELFHNSEGEEIITQFLIENEDRIRTLYEQFVYLENQKEIDLASKLLHTGIIQSIQKDRIIASQQVQKITMRLLFRKIDTVISGQQKNLKFIKENSKDLWQAEKLYKGFESNKEVCSELMPFYTQFRKEIIFQLIQDSETKGILTDILTCSEGKEMLKTISQIDKKEFQEFKDFFQNYFRQQVKIQDLNQLLQQQSQNQNQPAIEENQRIVSVEEEKKQNEGFNLNQFLVQNCIQSQHQLQGLLQRLSQQERNNIIEGFQESTYNFEGIQKMLERSVRNVKSTLEQQFEVYDVTNWSIKYALENPNKNIIVGVKKFGVPIMIVIRPTDCGRIIFHNKFEVHTLKKKNAELWGDNGYKTRQISIGDMVDQNNIYEWKISF